MAASQKKATTKSIDNAVKLTGGQALFQLVGLEQQVHLVAADLVQHLVKPITGFLPSFLPPSFHCIQRYEPDRGVCRPAGS